MMHSLLALTFLLITNMPPIGSISGGMQYLELFRDYVGVPKGVHLGLLSNSSMLEYAELTAGYCFQYNPLDNPRCQFYSDCCVMSPPRVREQLPVGTFSCHDGYYIVDRCSKSTDDVRLKDLCEKTDHLSGR